nr:MAG TPA: NinB protein [Caudoviricetes sp.]
MKLTVKGLQTLKGIGYINLVIPIPLSEETEINKIDTEKQYIIEVKQKRKDRSLDANAALWALLGEMAAKLRTSKDELYMEMLSRYGVFTHVVVKPAVVDRVKAEWRTVRVLGEVVINGQTGIQLQCYFGSSTYNTEEFSRLLDGVISDAKELGITLISDADRALMLAEWGQKDG